VEHYIRFGQWPKDEKSKIGESYRRSKAWIYNAIGEKQPEFEVGVSVYGAEWDDKKQRWVIPTLGSDSYVASLDELIDRRLPIYLVTGDEQDEPGTDGEPLLRNVKLIKELKYSEIYNDHCYDEDILLEDEKPPFTPHKVSYILKRPKKSPQIRNQAITVENIQKELGGYFQMYRILPEGIIIFVRELDFPDPKVKFNVFWPSLGPLIGPILISALRPHSEIELEHKNYPWPWNKAAEENEIGAPGEDYRSLRTEEITSLIKFLNKISKIK